MANIKNQTCLSWLGFSNPDVSVSRYRTHAGYRLLLPIKHKNVHITKNSACSRSGKGKPSGDSFHNNARWLKDIRYLIGSLGEEDIKCPVYNRELNNCLNYGAYHQHEKRKNLIRVENSKQYHSVLFDDQYHYDRYHYNMFDTRDCTVPHQTFKGYKGLLYEDQIGKFSKTPPSYLRKPLQKL